MISKFHHDPWITPFRKNLMWSLAAHAVVIAFVVLTGFFFHRKPIEPIQWIDLAPEFGRFAPVTFKKPMKPSTPAVMEPTTSPLLSKPKTSPAQVPEPRPSKPNLATSSKFRSESSLKIMPKEPTPSTPEKARPFSREKPGIMVSNKKWVRSANSLQTKASSSSSHTVPFDAPAFAKKLLKKLPDTGDLITAKGTAGSGTSTKGQANDFAWYFNHIFQEMYGAWQPPFGLAEGLHTQILLRIEKSGVISKISLAGSSGNQLMDESALAAANRVNKLKPPPNELGDSHAEITVTFRVQKI